MGHFTDVIIDHDATCHFHPGELQSSFVFSLQQRKYACNDAAENKMNQCGESIDSRCISSPTNIAFSIPENVI